jgi:transposase
MKTAADNTAETLSEALAEKDRLLAEQAAQIEKLRNRIRLLEKALFGPRSERLIDCAAQLEFEGMLKELEETAAELEKQEENVEPPAPAPAKKRRRRRNLQDLIPEDLPEEQIVIDLKPEEKVDDETGEPLVRIGEERVVKLAYTPGSYRRRVYVYPKYAVPGRTLCGVKQAPAPDFAIPGGIYDESFLAAVVFDKCAMHLPLYRQAERLNSLGIDISRQSLSHLYIRTAGVFSPLYEAMKADILARGVIFTDDTPVNLQVKGRGKTVTGRMWVYVGGGTGPPYRVFEFTVDRSKKRPIQFLNGFRGYIHADAYKGYDDLFAQDGVHECACWMHVRRKFLEAVDAPCELREEILRLIRMIYRYERVLRGKPDEIVVAVRRERTAAIIDRIFERTRDALTDGEILPGSAFAAAIGYMHNLGDTLRTFLGDARLRPDNGESERAIRPLAIGRKNWLFAGSKRGGDATGILLSLIQTCRAMDIDPFVYLEDVLRRINGHPANRIAELLPGNWTRAESYYG